MANRHKPFGNTEETQNRYEETKARLQKMKDAGYTVVLIWGVSLENYCVTLLALKMNFARTPL
jgi:esterase/lipase